jgi:hypothetical protein
VRNFDNANFRENNGLAARSRKSVAHALSAIGSRIAHQISGTEVTLASRACFFRVRRLDAAFRSQAECTLGLSNQARTEPHFNLGQQLISGMRPRF